MFNNKICSAPLLYPAKAGYAPADHYETSLLVMEMMMMTDDDGVDDTMITTRIIMIMVMMMVVITLTGKDRDFLEKDY